ncbi:hypothetical protein D9758_001923 [Tetrapyrgos nigripes]|uniref:peptide chain release factor N(5)-glutamine methyltransferase n=1 Tax=Tetrapyrgos nigripes TaxID=182062 RepID=A0A8H5LV50_9AGAR|nr:hypothetical protein D9758_001923 [Tetrapyrgos nigripes]
MTLLSLLEKKWLRQAASSPAHFQSLLRRRRKGEPLQYIIGTQPFGPLNLRVRPPILIPRPETEHWAIQLADRIQNRPRRTLLDLGTGSGCISLLLTHLCPALSAHAVDVNPAAVELANENALLCSIDRFQAFQADFLHQDFPSHPSLSPPYDILVSNPPYIPLAEYLTLSDDVKKYEDPRALLGGNSGLDFYHAIARLAVRERFLSPDAIIALEVGHNQADAVSAILQSAKLRTDVWPDPWGIPRTIFAYR